MRNTNAVTPQTSTFGSQTIRGRNGSHTVCWGGNISVCWGGYEHTPDENNVGKQHSMHHPPPPHTHTKSELKMRKALSDLINARYATLSLSLCKFKVGKLSWPGLYKDVRVQHNVRSWKTPAEQEQEVRWQEAASRSCRCNCPLSRSLPHLCSGQTQTHRHQTSLKGSYDVISECYKLRR